jgi:hypothetical protein
MFPVKDSDSMLVKVSFKIGDEKLLIEKWKDAQETEGKSEA